MARWIEIKSDKGCPGMLDIDDITAVMPDISTGVVCVVIGGVGMMKLTEPTYRTFKALLKPEIVVEVYGGNAGLADYTKETPPIDMGHSREILLG